jgi:Winged helix DNA-binding domain
VLHPMPATTDVPSAAISLASHAPPYPWHMVKGESHVLQARLRAQLLTDRSGQAPTEVVRHLLAVQAQDALGFRLAVRARSRGLSANDVDEALGRKELVVSWLNRGTLHLVTAEDYWWLHHLTTPSLVTGNVRRLRQEGVTAKQAERGIDEVMTAVGEGPQTRAALRERLDAAGVPTAGQAIVHILFAATLRGLLLRGPKIGPDHAFVSVAAWLGSGPPPMDRAEALAVLASRYLVGHAPASAQDLAKWAGIALTDARSGMRSATEVAPLGGRLPAPRLLGPFDPLLHGWISRDLVVGDHAGVVTTNGIFRAVALVRGRVVATWSLPGGVVTIAPLESIRAADLSKLVADAADVQRFLGHPDRPAAVIAGPRTRTVR